jgi:hypothetical protein
MREIIYRIDIDINFGQGYKIQQMSNKGKECHCKKLAQKRFRLVALRFYGVQNNRPKQRNINRIQ